MIVILFGKILNALVKIYTFVGQKIYQKGEKELNMSQNYFCNMLKQCIRSLLCKFSATENVFELKN
jgi:hypothetical protein